MKQRIAIIVYHSVDRTPDICTISPDAFRRQMDFIRDHFPIIRLDEIREALVDQGSTIKVIITFDDALTDFYECAYPILDKYKIPSTVFVATGFIGGFNDWDAPFHKCRKKSVMNANELRELHKTKLVEFGSHGIDHLPMSRLEVDEMRRQLAGSKSMLEDLLSTSITMFAYPYGRLRDISPLTTQILSNTDYKIGVTTRWGTRHSVKDILCLRRIYLREMDSQRMIKSKIEGLFDWIPLLKEKVIFGMRTLRM